LSRFRIGIGQNKYCVGKPFHYPELTARIAAVLRRARGRREQGVLKVEELRIDPVAREVTLGERRVELSAKEFALLRMLAAEPTRVYTKEELLRGYRLASNEVAGPSYSVWLICLDERSELSKRPVLNLADALACEVEKARKVSERAWLLVAESIPQLENSPLAIREVLECLAQGLLCECLGGTLVRRLRPLIGDELPKLRLPVIPHRHLERDR
jgi:hypothetical protein